MQDKTQDILNNYFVVLDKREKYGMAMPLSTLPHTKTEIKNAIKSAISETDRAEERDRLKKGFITLSEFIPDAVLERVSKDWKNVADAECEIGEGNEAAAESSMMEDVVKVQKSIADEGAQLAQEIEAFLHNIP